MSKGLAEAMPATPPSRYHVRLPPLPASWSYRYFGDVINVQGGGQPPKSQFRYEPTPGYVQLLQIRDFGEKPVPTFVREETVTKRCVEEDVLIARYGASLGRIVNGKRGAYNVALAKVIFDRNQFYNRYLFYLLQTPFFQTPIHMISRSAQNGFNKGDLSDILLPVAPRDEQENIVAEIEKQFTRLDAGVASLTRIQRALKRYRASVLKAACEGRLVPTEAELARKENRSYETGEQLLERILKQRREKWNGKGSYEKLSSRNNSELPALPEGWAWATVEQLAAPEPNSITDGPFGSNLKTEHYTNTGPRVIRLQNIGNGTFIDEEAHISEKHFERLQKHRVFAGDVVIAALGEKPPRSCLIPESVGPAIVKADCIRFKPHADVVTKYANFALNSDPVRKRTQNIVHGVGRPRLNLGEIKSILLPLAPPMEQQRIVAEIERRLSLIEELEAVASTELQRATRLRQSVLQRAFEGRLANTHSNGAI